MTRKDHLTCPRCGDTDNLILFESHEEWGSTNPGRILKDERGDLLPPSIFEWSAGDPLTVLVQCSECRHEWKPRKGRVSVVNLEELQKAVMR